MHHEALAWVRAQVEKANLAPNSLIIEIGSRQVCGTIRDCFPADCRYVGVDIYRGPLVDVQADGLAPPFANGIADVVACCEVLEHVRDKEMLAFYSRFLVKPGGLLLITAATYMRKPHSALTSAPVPEPGEFYENVRPEKLLCTVLPVTNCGVEVHLYRGDVYLWARV